jgi:hypothetical protein
MALPSHHLGNTLGSYVGQTLGTIVNAQPISTTNNKIKKKKNMYGSAIHVLIMIIIDVTILIFLILLILITLHYYNFFKFCI